jgi:hypothetical protein
MAEQELVGGQVCLAKTSDDKSYKENIANISTKKA